MAKQYVCEYCGDTFERRGKRIPRYCSMKCHDDARRFLLPMPCIQCGKAFTPKHRNIKHCSLECSHKTTKQTLSHKIACTCLMCGKVTMRSPALATKYCSPECYYASKFTTPEGYKKWRRNQDFRSAQRNSIKQRDGYKCVLCGSTDKLQIDHILPIGLGGGNAIENGQTLCRSCHALKTTKDKRLIRALKLG